MAGVELELLGIINQDLRNFGSFVSLFLSFLFINLFLMRKYHDHFEPKCFYHIYNRAIGSERLFKEEENYIFFLKKWDKYLGDKIDVWAYCLIPNHFHFLIRVKNKTLSNDNSDINKFLEGQFKKLFSSYALSYNKVFSRTGSLFQKSFKRIKVNSQNYLLTLIHYIHHNPIHHNLTDDFLIGSTHHTQL